jgi:protein gp37
MANRLHAMGMERYRNNFRVTLHDDLLTAPLHWVKPKIVFVNSMSDLFHETVPLEFIARMFETMVNCPQHIFQVLTKRSERLQEVAHSLPWMPNIWMGVSVENEKVIHRVCHLTEVPAHIRFLSCEPLIGPLNRLPLDKIHWVIVGGESGPGARPMKHEWVDSILAQCREHAVPFFFKQWGGVRKDRTGRLLHGQTYNEMPLTTGTEISLEVRIDR